jgi:glycosyltransferase involved in cell wall biosynthesis
MKKRVSLVWAKTARRSSTLAQLLGAKLIILSIDRKGISIRLSQYLILAIRTFFILLKENPDFIICQCPPIQILFPSYCYSKIRKAVFVVDAHTGAFIGKGFHFPVYRKILKFFLCRARLTIIPNQGLVDYLLAWKISYFILEDGLPNLEVKLVTEKLEKSVVLISGGGSDEPIEEVIKAARLVPEVKIFITGVEMGKKEESLSRNLKNLTFTGFLLEPEYLNLLRQAEVIMVLTTRPNTILCGAYEALSLEKPMILSNTKTLSHHFTKGIIAVENTAEGIAQGIKQLFLILPQLQSEILQLKSEKTKEWLDRTRQLKEQLGIDAKN